MGESESWLNDEGVTVCPKSDWLLNVPPETYGRIPGAGAGGEAEADVAEFMPLPAISPVMLPIDY